MQDRKRRIMIKILSSMKDVDFVNTVATQGYSKEIKSIKHKNPTLKLEKTNKKINMRNSI